MLTLTEEREIQPVDYSKPWLLFTIAAILATSYMLCALLLRWRSWSYGIKEERANKRYGGHVIKIWFAEIVLQRQLRNLSFARWLIHMLIFVGFTGLVLLSIWLAFLREMSGLGWDSALANIPLGNEGYVLIKLWGNAFGLILLLGLASGSVRRFFLRPPTHIDERTDAFLLIFLLWLTLSGFALEGLRLSLVSADIARYSFVGRMLAYLSVRAIKEPRPLLTLLWTVHAFSGLALLVYLPHSKLLHSIVAPIIIARNAIEEQERRDLYWPELPRLKADGSRKG